MFRPFRLVSLAAQAETLRLKRVGRGYAFQVGYGIGAVVFAVLLLIMLHLAAFAALAPGQGPVLSAIIIAAVDLVLAGLLGWLASRERHDPVEHEAQLVRDNAVRQLTDTAGRALMVAPLLRSQSAKKGLLGAALTAAVVGLLARR
ncbi:hypothetical protein M0638_03700 [Roseomonas sp. NAR14]|uniref:Uncharacterized protein n=1 Tax=Roseomonas acroporae TaxID=2937791 RepID=A0A9X1Y4Q1_9PROT|nr:hypothetical protein [Roseomonas acroporae]MCK8783486.1 hypothetical protein [Roseomonas acroporae]